jgi:hypothetical protein
LGNVTQPRPQIEGAAMPSRKAISTRARFEVFKRDGFKCQYCGATPPRVILHVDHIKPVKLGGDNSQENLITACEECNGGKSAVPLSSVPKSLADKAKEIAEREAQIIGYTQVMEAARQRLEGEAWAIVDIMSPGSSEKGCPRSKFATVKRFVSMLGLHEVMEAAEITRDKFTRESLYSFKYFCGICWTKARGPKE